MSKPNPTQNIIQVEQIIECNDIKAVNEFLKSGNWVLLHTYRKYGNKLMYSIGKIKNEKTRESL